MKEVNVVRSYRDLLVWQEAMTLAQNVYQLAAALPSTERFALSQQLRRAAISIPSNIAEGYARESGGSYLHFLKISRGSLREIETQALLAERLALADSVTTGPVLTQCDKVGRLMHGLIKSVERNTLE